MDVIPGDIPSSISQIERKSREKGARGCNEKTTNLDFFARVVVQVYCVGVFFGTTVVAGILELLENQLPGFFGALRHFTLPTLLGFFFAMQGLSRCNLWTDFAKIGGGSLLVIAGMGAFSGQIPASLLLMLTIYTTPDDISASCKYVQGPDCQNPAAYLNRTSVFQSVKMAMLIFLTMEE